ncbi:MAG TPA: hypothetical protein PKV72_05850 [Candidatus Peribacteria bacterium]|nr:hypothetical protein [Candidatus Peribacteria bacterium]
MKNTKETNVLGRIGYASLIGAAGIASIIVLLSSTDQSHPSSPMHSGSPEKSSTSQPANQAYPSVTLKRGATPLREAFDDTDTEVVITSVRKEHGLPYGSYDSDPLKTGEVYVVFSALLNRIVDGEYEGYPIHYQKYVRVASSEGFSSLPSLMLVTRGTTNGPYIAVGESKLVDIYVRVIENEGPFTATFKNGNVMKDLF